MKQILIYFIFLCFFFFGGCADDEPETKKWNVVFIAVDDLRPELGCYGQDYMYTPHIDKLASESRVFMNHFVSTAACGPSRSTLLSGKRTLDWDVFKSIRDSGVKPDSIFSLPQLFKENGYKTVGIGKISHQPGGVIDSLQRIHEVPYSWNLSFAPSGKWKNPWNAFFSYDHGKFRSYGYNRENDISLPPFEMADVNDEGYADGLNAQAAIEQLSILKDTTFFLAVGFYKPHLPFNAPKKYWDLYDSDRIPQSLYPYPPNKLNSKISLHSNRESYEPRTHYTWPGDTSNYILTAERRKILKHGYCASVSYVDAQIGKVLDKIKDLGIEDRTLIVLWGDHGWHLGDYGIWGKYTNYDFALRSPLIIKVPGGRFPGKRTESLVETVDLFPTLAELCGLPMPNFLEGKSLKCILENPDFRVNDFTLGWRQAFGATGYTIRDDEYRLMVWNRKDMAPEIELFHYSGSKEPTENLALQFPEKVDELWDKMIDCRFYNRLESE